MTENNKVKPETILFGTTTKRQFQIMELIM